MATVSGLRSVGGNTPRTTSKDGRVNIPRPTSRNTGLSPSAGATGASRGTPAMPNDQRLGQLADALTQLNPALQQYMQKNNDAMDEAVKQQLPYLVDILEQSYKDGLVEKSQMKEIFPELSPANFLMIQEALAKRKAKRETETAIEEVLANDDLRLNSADRNEFFQTRRAEALEAAWADANPVFASAYMSQFDSTTREWERQFMQETANFHEDVLKESMAEDVRQALKEGGDLLAIDQTFNNSSLNKLERKDVVMSTAISVALAEENPEILDQIPELFLNADNKARIKQAKEQIQTAQWTRFSRSRQAEAYARDAEIRQGKIGMLNRMAQGYFVSPAEFVNTPELFSFASQHQTTSMINEGLSVNNRQFVQNNVAQAAITGDWEEAFQYDPNISNFMDEGQMTLEGLNDYILSLDVLNAKDKIALMQNAEDIWNSRSVLRDPDITAAYSPLAEDIRAFHSSRNGMMVATEGINLNTTVRRVYDSTIMAGVLNHIQTTGDVPRGADKQAIVDRALQRAEHHKQEVKRSVGIGLDLGVQDQVREAETRNTPLPRGQSNRSPNDTQENEEGLITRGGYLWRKDPETGRLTLVEDEDE